MIRFSHVVLAALTVTVMTAAVSADDIVVHAPAGSEIVTFTEAEETSITAQELRDLIKSSLENLDELNILADAKADISLDMGEDMQLPISGSVIASGDLKDEKVYSNVYYTADVFGEVSDGTFGSYMWKSDGMLYTAIDSGDGWSLTATQDDDPKERLIEAMDELDDETLSLFTPKDHLYEANGKKYYIVEADKDTILGTASAVEAAAQYTQMAESILGDNDLQFVLAVEAETGFPYVISLDASNASGSLPGALFGSETDIGFTGNDLYVSVFFSQEAVDIEIPKDVLSLEANQAEADLSAMLDALMTEGAGAAAAIE